MTWPNIRYPVYDRCGWHNCPEKKSRRAFCRNDEKVASSKKHTQFETRVIKPYPIKTKMAKIDILFMTKTIEERYPLGRTYLFSPCILVMQRFGVVGTVE